MGGIPRTAAPAARFQVRTLDVAGGSDNTHGIAGEARVV